jgi:lipoprotein
MKKISKYVMLFLTALALTTTVVSCSKDKDEEPDPIPTPTPTPDEPTPQPDDKSIIGYWQEKYSYFDGTSYGEEVTVWKFQNNGTSMMYWWEKYNEDTEKGINALQYYYDKDKRYFVYYGKDDDWGLVKVIELDNNILTIGLVHDSDEDSRFSGPLNDYKCQQIIDYYYELGADYNNDEIIMFTRITENQFINWWNSVS